MRNLLSDELQYITGGANATFILSIGETAKYDGWRMEGNGALYYSGFGKEILVWQCNEYTEFPRMEIAYANNLVLGGPGLTIDRLADGRLSFEIRF